MLELELHLQSVSSLALQSHFSTLYYILATWHFIAFVIFFFFSPVPGRIGPWLFAYAIHNHSAGPT